MKVATSFRICCWFIRVNFSKQRWTSGGFSGFKSFYVFHICFQFSRLDSTFQLYTLQFRLKFCYSEITNCRHIERMSYNSKFKIMSLWKVLEQFNFLVTRSNSLFLLVCNSKKNFEYFVIRNRKFVESWQTFESIFLFLAQQRGRNGQNS